METCKISDEKLNSIILTWSVAAGLADITPIVGADLAAVAGLQLQMFYALLIVWQVNEYQGALVLDALESLLGQSVASGTFRETVERFR